MADPLETLKTELERFGEAMIVDNATSHVDEVAPFVALVTADLEFATCLVPVGKGEFLAVKASS